MSLGNIMRRLLAIAIMAVLPLTVLAQQRGIRIEHAWSRAALAGRTGVVYLTVINSGAPDQLTGVSTPIAASAGLHQSSETNGIMKMRPVTSISVAPGQAAALKPGGYHIMLMDLKQPLAPGQSFPLTLTFAKAGTVTTMVAVKKAGATSDMDGMDAGSMHGVMHH